MKIPLPAAASPPLLATRDTLVLLIMNQNRRVFRGRGGPTDRRLPKQNARRRRPASSCRPGQAVPTSSLIDFGATLEGNQEEQQQLINGSEAYMAEL